MILRISSYKRLNQLIQNETFEPMISWGIRMAISATIPLIWGLYSGHVQQAVWITLTAEALCWVELKGSFSWRLRTLAMGSILAIVFSILGSVTGSNPWLSAIAMFGVAFLASILKNLGDRASGLAICVYLLFILGNAFPVGNVDAVKERLILVIIGAFWPVLVGITISIFMPVEQPYRRQIALIWRAIGNLVTTVAKGWDGTGLRTNVRQVYEREKDVRTAIDNSFQFYSTTADQANEQNKTQYQLAHLRKATSLVAVHLISISEELELISIKELDPSLRVKLSTLFNAWDHLIERMSVFVITLKPEEKLLVASRINRLKRLTLLIKEYPMPANEVYSKAITRIIQLTERAVKLMDSAMGRLEKIGDDKPVFRSYTLIKTLFILNPRFIFSSLRVLFNFNTNTARYALRSAIAATVALFIYKWYNIGHGYWLPFSVMIVIQPYFGATLKKALDRVAGTLAGGLAGGLFISLHTSLHIREIMLFISFVLMVYYIRKQYAIAAFVITLNLVLLFNLESAINPALILTRALCTIGGASFAVIAGFVLLPTWDRKWLPIYLAKAIDCNYKYFVATFFPSGERVNWIRNKRNAEVSNSNVFDSFSRYMEEPTGKDRSTLYYDIITHNVRITRTLNNIHLEQEERYHQPTGIPTSGQRKKITECLEWFNRVVQLVTQINPEMKVSSIDDETAARYQPVFSEVQAMQLEKLLIELTTIHHDLEILLAEEHPV